MILVDRLKLLVSLAIEASQRSFKIQQAPMEHLGLFTVKPCLVLDEQALPQETVTHNRCHTCTSPSIDQSDKVNRRMTIFLSLLC